ncbi:unnamed protein product [Allacma fusca]|uniref:Uncharacterized protein n=1 Tax=Allacma fusca TaxID=39272 RepID=A0A8J2PEZ5_9HEXA|nr:unnamed protein product [Allacma fusca]
MNHLRIGKPMGIIVNGDSPTKDDFDRLIEEQDCFEISLRHERARTNSLVKEIRKLKKEHRRDVLRFEKEIMQQKANIEHQEEIMKTLEKQNWDQKMELEQLKFKSSRTQFLHQVPEVGEIAEKSGTEGEKVLQRTHSERKFKNAASLVAQLIQGFEAAAVANNPPPTYENVRRRRTVHGYRTVTFLRD